MPITIISRDGKVHSLREIVQERPDLEGKIAIKKQYFRVSKKIRKNYATVSFSENGGSLDNSDMILSFCDEIKNRAHSAKLRGNGTYPSRVLSHILGEGIYNLEQQSENSYKIIHPKK